MSLFESGSLVRGVSNRVSALSIYLRDAKNCHEYLSNELLTPNS